VAYMHGTLMSSVSDQSTQQRSTAVLTVADKMSTTDASEYSTVGVENTSVQPLPPLRPPPPSLPLASITVGFVTGVGGMCANAVVLVVLIFARRHLGSHVNTLITNQSAIDLLACVFLAVGSGVSFPGTPNNYLELGQIGNDLVCFLFRHRMLAIMSMNADKIGLVVISLERYFKIVHAIVHRKYYRKWMTVVGVVVPWITAFCTFAVPAAVSTRSVPGQCPVFGLSESEQTVRS